VEALARAAEPEPVVRSSLARFAAAVAADPEVRHAPVIRGELRASYGHAWSLQGTLATRARLKRANAQAERLLLREAEPWAALAARRGGRSRRHLLDAAWRTLLLCHPHDTLCGCSVDEVARAMAARLEDAMSQGAAIRDDALMELAGHDPVAARTAVERWRPVVLVRNVAPHARAGIAELEVVLPRQHVPVGPGSGGQPPPPAPIDSFTLDEGSVTFQVIAREVRHELVESARHYPRAELVDVVRVLAWTPSVEGYGTRAVTIQPGASGRSPLPVVRVGPRSMRHDQLAVEVTHDGDVRLEADAWRAAIPSLIGFEDVGDVGDSYTHSPVGPRAVPTTMLRQRVMHSGPIRGELHVVYSLRVPVASSRRGRSADIVEMDLHVSLALDAGAPFVRVRVRGENAARDHRLRIVFRTGIRDGAVWADAAFGPARRAQVGVSPDAAAIEQPPATAPLHRYVTVAAESLGATLFSDGLAEYEVTRGGDIAVTLLRAVGELSRNDLPERPGHAGWPSPTPEAQSLGPFEASFAVMLHGPRDDALAHAIERAADDVLLPLRGATLRAALDVPAPTHGVRLDGEGLAFSACKESEDGRWMVLRCVNLTERDVPGRWRVGGDVREARLARLDETPLDPLAVADGAVSFVAPARAVVTVLVR
jgi:hypothetical protein